MPELIETSGPPERKHIGGSIIDWLRRAGARRLTNGILRLLMLGRRADLAASAPQDLHLEEPTGPFASAPARDAPALLIFVPRSVRSRLIDGATGGYGYSHLAVDCAEIDTATGKRVMIESVPGQPVHRSFQDDYGGRPYVRIPLAGKDLNVDAFCDCVRSKIGEAYDDLEALTWGEVDDPAKQICSDLAAACLPAPILEQIASLHLAGRLPRHSVSVHHHGTPAFHAFVSPNGLAAYFGAPPGEDLLGVEHLVPIRGSHHGALRPLRAKLIYNPAAGSAGQSGTRLTEILEEMERWLLVPEVHVVTPRSRLDDVAADAIRRGFRLIVVAGGDGTINNVVGGLVGTRATLGILPAGTRNNVAESLGIQSGNIVEAVEVLRRGRRLRVDVGRASCNGRARWLLEAGAVGLASAMFPAADQLQHGDLTHIADLVGTFVGAAPSRLYLTLDGGRQVVFDEGHLVLVANMPYMGAHFYPSSKIVPDDGLLDVLVFGQLGKLDLINYALQISTGGPDDPRVAHHRVRSVDVRAEPEMPVIADGEIMGRGSLHVTLHPRALSIMAGPAKQESPYGL